ncbi:hypothetical protein Tco_0720041 [Tanacetum coccineum]
MLHGVPITAFIKDALRVIATKLGTPVMLDSYTSDMCMQIWGRSSYARSMIELRADVELKDTIVVLCQNLLVRGSICTLYVLNMSKNLLGVRVARETKQDDDHDPYDNDMYDSHDMSFLGKGFPQ